MINGKNSKTANKQTSGLAITSLVLGIFSFIPLFGVPLGILAVIFGVVSFSKIKKGERVGKKLAIAGIILGVCGILFNVILYSSLYYYGFVAKKGVFVDLKTNLTREILTTNAGQLELYKKTYGQYPLFFADAENVGYKVSDSDAFGKPLEYWTFQQQQDYFMFSAGPDKIFGTEDDLIESFPINQIPMYDGVEKPQDLKEADEQFISEVINLSKTKENASNQLQSLGWNYLGEGDVRTAIKRFNQAWLLNPEDPGVYWGFGAVLGFRREYYSSLEMFSKALELEGKSHLLEKSKDLPAFFCDFSNTYYARYSIYLGHDDDLAKSLELQNKSLSLNPQLNCTLHEAYG